MLEFKVALGNVSINTITIMSKSEDIFVLHIDTDEKWPEFDGAMYEEEGVTLFLCNRDHGHSDNTKPTRVKFETPGVWRWGTICQPAKYGLQVVIYKAIEPTDDWETIWVNPELVEKHRILDNS